MTSNIDIKKLDCSGGWSDMCSNDYYKHLKNNPSLRTFYNVLKMNMIKEEQKTTGTGVFDAFLSKKTIENSPLKKGNPSRKAFTLSSRGDELLSYKKAT